MSGFKYDTYINSSLAPFVHSLFLADALKDDQTFALLLVLLRLLLYSFWICLFVKQIVSFQMRITIWSFLTKGACKSHTSLADPLRGCDFDLIIDLI